MRTILLLFICLLSLAANPATILQDKESAAGAFFAPHFKGQSFLAEDPFITSIGIGLRVFNPVTADTTFTLSLFGGRGIDGPLLAQHSVSPFGNYDSLTVVWANIAMDDLPVIPGQPYTFTIQSPNPYWGAMYKQYATYSGGEFITENGFNPSVDLAFRVDGVPEPCTGLILLVGMVGLLWWKNDR